MVDKSVSGELSEKKKQLRRKSYAQCSYVCIRFQSEKGGGRFWKFLSEYTAP
jgi:hypothetical protein